MILLKKKFHFLIQYLILSRTLLVPANDVSTSCSFRLLSSSEYYKRALSIRLRSLQTSAVAMSVEKPAPMMRRIPTIHCKLF